MISWYHHETNQIKLNRVAWFDQILVDIRKGNPGDKNRRIDKIHHASHKAPEIRGQLYTPEN